MPAGNYGSISVQSDLVKKHGSSSSSTAEKVNARRRTLAMVAAVVAAVLGVSLLLHVGNTQSDSSLPIGVEQPVAKENIPLFFDQAVDHFDDDNEDRWSHRYYAQAKHFKGPGHPIFLVVGGEGGNDRGFFYPFVEEHLAREFGAFCLHPEHRCVLLIANRLL